MGNQTTRAGESDEFVFDVPEGGADVSVGFPNVSGAFFFQSSTVQNPDPAMDDIISIYKTALAIITVGWVFSPSESLEALNWLLAGQEANGDWNGDAFDTAMALWAVLASLDALDPDGDKALGNACDVKVILKSDKYE